MEPDRKGPGVLVSAVIPAYNESGPIARVIAEAAPLVDEIIVVDDGSSDGTFSVLRAAKQRVPALIALRLERHCGQTAAFDAGFKAARGRVVITLDADLQNDPAGIPGLLAALEHCDVACGYRRERHDSLTRRISSRIANRVRNALTHEQIRDVGCSLRAVKAECLRDLKLYDGMHRFLPTLLKLGGWTVTEVPVDHRPRRWGKGKYGVWNRLFRGLRDVFAVRWMRSRWLDYRIAERLE